MRLEIIVPDSTRQDLKDRLATVAQRLTDNPEWVEEIYLEDDDVEDAAIQKMFTPERLAHIDKALADVKAGHALTMEQVEAELAANKAEWLAANQH